MLRVGIQEILGIGKTRFIVLLKDYQHNPDSFSISYKRTAGSKLSAEEEEAIKRALLKEKGLVKDPDLPISGYNYTALQDRLRKEGIDVSVITIIDRAKKYACHRPRRKKKVHDREVATSSVAELMTLLLTYGHPLPRRNGP